MLKDSLEKNIISNRPITKRTVDWYAYQMEIGQWTISG